jgi:hypothetical protein
MKPLNPEGNVVITIFNGFGDEFLALSVLREVGRRFAGRKVYLATYIECINLFFKNLGFHFLQPIYPPNNGHMVVALIDDLDGLDIQQIVSLNCYTPNSVDMDLVSLYPSLPRWAFYDAVGNSVIPAQGKHMRDLYFDVLGWEANYSLSDRQAIISPEQTEKFSQLYQRWISENGERAYALHLDTHNKKMWAIEKWTEVVSHLWRRWNAWPIVLGKDSESSRKLEQSFRFVRKLPSKPMALHLSAVKLLEVFIGVDSIFAHIADSYLKPMVALYGPTDLALWGPMNPQAWVVRPDGGAEMSSISIDKVICTVDGAFQQIYPFPRALRGGIII